LLTGQQLYEQTGHYVAKFLYNNGFRQAGKFLNEQWLNFDRQLPDNLPAMTPMFDAAQLCAVAHAQVSFERRAMRIGADMAPPKRRQFEAIPPTATHLLDPVQYDAAAKTTSSSSRSSSRKSGGGGSGGGGSHTPRKCTRSRSRSRSPSAKQSFQNGGSDSRGGSSSKQSGNKGGYNNSNPGYKKENYRGGKGGGRGGGRGGRGGYNKRRN